MYVVLFQTREVAYRVYLHHNEESEEILEDMLAGRQIIAQMTGFDTFAHRALKGTLAETPGMFRI